MNDDTEDHEPRGDTADAAPEPREREIVVPGDLLAEGGLINGQNTYRIGNRIFAAQLGIKSINAKYVNVIPLSGPYIPKPGDIVIGVVIDLMPNSWIIDINSPYNLPLASSEAPWRIDYGELTKYLNIADAVLMKIVSVDEIKRVQSTMKGPGLHKLNSGQILEISPLTVPRVIGKNGSMIALLKKNCNCKLFVGQNGRIWLDGNLDRMAIAIKAIRMIEQNAHKSGLTNIIENYLKNKIGELPPQQDPVQN